jgi:multidrug efflux pump subunit AcrA (membrane-fusion protein)
VADVVEDDLPTLALGQGSVVSIDALGLDAPGTVTTIAPSTEASTASVVTFPVTVTLDDPDARIRPGMSADVEITVASATDAIAIPAVALQGTSGGYVVEVQTADGGTEARAVTVGLMTETLAEITSGLAEGDAVVVGTSADRIVTDSGQQGGFGGPGGFGSGLGGGGVRFVGGPPQGGPGGGD